MQDLYLMKIGSSTSGFTWLRGKSKRILDRVFVNLEWLSIFPSLNVTLLRQGLSDHSPLLVNSKMKNWGRKPFRFQNHWFPNSKCLKIVKESWPNSSISMVEKLHVIKQKLKQWNHESFGNIDSNIATL